MALKKAGTAAIIERLRQVMAEQSSASNKSERHHSHMQALRDAIAHLAMQECIFDEFDIPPPGTIIGEDGEDASHVVRAAEMIALGRKK